MGFLQIDYVVIWFFKNCAKFLPSNDGSILTFVTNIALWIITIIVSIIDDNFFSYVVFKKSCNIYVMITMSIRFLECFGILILCVNPMFYKIRFYHIVKIYGGRGKGGKLVGQ